MGVLIEQRARPGRTVNQTWLAALETSDRLTSAPGHGLPSRIDDLATQFGAAPALLSDRETLSFEQLADRSRRYTRWALSEGLGRGDAVALMMPNRPEYVAIWLGITRTGAAVALINTHLTGAALAHCLSIATPRHVIVAAELADRVDSATQFISGSPRVWLHGGDSAKDQIDRVVNEISGAPLDEAEMRPLGLSDLALYIYTSGTTGLPKAARVSHRRILSWCGWFAGLMGTTSGDRLYNCLPMYHSVGGVVAVGGVLVNGGAVVLKEKFSAREFWADIVRWDCTLFQYIGELCRYLLAAPERPEETQHKLRLACGNGLAADVWERFRHRFHIPHVLEFYAATEGTFSLYNVEGEPGAIGRIPGFLSHRFPAAIVKFDPDKREPARGADGHCIRCERNETGEAIGRIADSGAGDRFEGYSSDVESSKKMLRDVFETGDAWFRTGDLMRQDSRGFFHFVDRVGDTFRWKGENVSTGEVAAALAECPGVIEVNVYGVPVPGADGKAGMAALVTDGTFALDTLRAHLERRLPAYARPIFIRMASQLAATETFKLKKQALAEEGFDPNVISDPLYVDIPALGCHKLLDQAMFQAISSGEIRL
jgi:fatty-acyl-CoA synthase